MDIATDFAQIVDGLEEVTLRRRDSNATVSVLTARRQQMRTREAEPSSGTVVEANAEWHLTLAEDAAPQVGDVVLDGADHRWTILEVEE